MIIKKLNKTIDTLKKKHKKQIIYIFLILNNKRNFNLKLKSRRFFKTIKKT